MEPLKHSGDVSRGVEMVPVSIHPDMNIKDVSDFVYVRFNVPGPDFPRKKFQSQFVGCHCDVDSCDSTCMCISRFGQVYDNNGTLMTIDPHSEKMKPIYECNKFCKCRKTCGNRVVQNGIKIKLQIFETELKGLGVKSLEDIPHNSFVCEYAGETIINKVAKDRTKNLKKDQPNYILVVTEHLADGETRTNIDPTYIGNVGRFINHSCEPNLYLVPVRINCDIPHLAMFALRDIKCGEELSYDYSGIVQETKLTEDSSSDNRDTLLKDENHSGDHEMTKCHCSSDRCKGVLPFDTSLYE